MISLHTSLLSAPHTQALPLLIERYLSIRQFSETLCQPLAIEDYGLQAMADTSPAKWHIAHTSWFFETFILKEFVSGYQPFHPDFEYLFNSYYNGVGRQYPRPMRHLLSRPTVAEVYDYRQTVDKAMLYLLNNFASDETAIPDQQIIDRLVLGLHHEQQHQELFLTDLKYCWFQNPLMPRYSQIDLEDPSPVDDIRWLNFDGGDTVIGASPNATNPDPYLAFYFDNESPAQQVLVKPFSMADRLITNGEYLTFIKEAGYKKPEHWLADGWTWVQQNALTQPLYWKNIDDQWFEFTLHGLVPLDESKPISHLSAYEADAYARWSDCRLPTEYEWETFATEIAQGSTHGQYVDSGYYHPRSNAHLTNNNNYCKDLLGSLWQWTSSAYGPYPGFTPATGAVGEYNGKFMCNQLVLRGGSCASSRDHIRTSYRNFFYPADRWQFSGLRLAKNIV